MAILDMKNATLTLKDGTAVPNTVEVKIGEGNLTYTEKKPRRYIKDKGALDLVTNEDEETVDVSLDFVWDYITTESAVTPVTIEDALKNDGEASGWASSDTDPCQSYAVDLYVLHDPGCTGVAEELLIFRDFRYEQLDHSLRDASVACTGRANVVEASATRQQFGTSNYVTNGDFASDLSDWVTDGSATWVAGVARLDYDSGPSTQAQIKQTYAAGVLPAGEYVLDWTQTNTTGTIDVVMLDGDSQVVSTTSSGNRAAGVAPVSFTIPVSDPGGELTFTAADASDIVDIDDVVIYRML